MNNQVSGRATTPGAEEAGSRREWPSFLLLAFVGLPIAMTLAIAAYGLIVWFLQILVFGPPS